jgi:hypothetical protein
LHVNLTKAQIEQSPPLDEGPVSRLYEEAFYRHFRLTPYWDTVRGPAANVMPYPGTVPRGLESIPVPTGSQVDPHLRRATAMTGFTIEVRDGHIGHVEDVVIDDDEWRARYLEVDTKTWLPGKKVLVDIGRIHRIDPEDRAVTITLTRRAIESAPPYDPDELITPDYEVQLFKHYSQAAA